MALDNQKVSANYNEELYESLKTKAPIMAEALKNDVSILNPVQKDFLKNLIKK